METHFTILDIPGDELVGDRGNELGQRKHRFEYLY